MNLIFEIAHESTRNELYANKLPQLYTVSSQMLKADVLKEKGVSLSVLRFDQLHPIISGNKIFKLHYFLEEIKRLSFGHVITYGGAYSNHLVAAAYACKLNNLKCTGIIRGERPQHLSHTLEQCLNYGMELKFVSRAAYRHKDEPDFPSKTIGIEGGYYSIPEGGYHPLGARGAALMMGYANEAITHVACAVGTATTIAGLLSAAKPHQQIIAFPVLKGMTDLRERIDFLSEQKFTDSQLHVASGYHFGGYAKADQQLFDFMNRLYAEHQLPTDFVYTAKMMYGIMDMIRSDFFKPGSKIVCMHTGGLQGNLSLQKGILTFA